MRGKLVVIEGLDASGKCTQAKLLAKHLRAKGAKVKLLHFPAYRTRWGSIVASYLRGDFGSKEEVSPYIASMLFAIDRYQFREKLFNHLMQGTHLILDRWTQSNMAFQGAKLRGVERKRFFEWIEEVEKELPSADAVVFLDMPPKVCAKLFISRKAKNLALKGARDIHERDRAYQHEVRRVYQELARKKDWITINCYSGERLKSPQEIHRELWRALERRGVI